MISLIASFFIERQSFSPSHPSLEATLNLSAVNESHAGILFARTTATLFGQWSSETTVDPSSSPSLASSLSSSPSLSKNKLPPHLCRFSSYIANSGKYRAVGGLARYFSTPSKSAFSLVFNFSSSSSSSSSSFSWLAPFKKTNLLTLIVIPITLFIGNVTFFTFFFPSVFSSARSDIETKVFGVDENGSRGGNEKDGESVWKRKKGKEKKNKSKAAAEGANSLSLSALVDLIEQGGGKHRDMNGEASIGGENENRELERTALRRVLNVAFAVNGLSIACLTLLSFIGEMYIMSFNVVGMTDMFSGCAKEAEADRAESAKQKKRKKMKK